MPSPNLWFPDAAALATETTLQITRLKRIVDDPSRKVCSGYTACTDEEFEAKLAKIMVSACSGVCFLAESTSGHWAAVGLFGVAGNNASALDS